MARHEPTALFDRPLIPVASEADAVVARDTILPYLASVSETAILAHVIRYTEGGVDPSPLDLQEEEAERLFDLATEGHEGLDVETRKAYGSGAVEAILETARDADVTVVVIAPRKKSLFMRLLAGDTAGPLMNNPHVPVLAVPNPSGDD